MAVTVAELAGALRINDGSAAPPAPTDGILTRLLAVSVAHISKRVSDDCPQDVQDEGAIRLSAYLFDQPNYARGASMHSAFRNSGAAALIEPWRQRRLGIQANNWEADESPAAAVFARVAVSTDVTLTTDEIDAGTSVAMAGPITLPSFNGNRYIFIGVPADAADLTSITLAGSNQISGFTRVAGAIGGFKWWRSANSLSDGVHNFPWTVA